MSQLKYWDYRWWQLGPDDGNLSYELGLSHWIQRRCPTSRVAGNHRSSLRRRGCVSWQIAVMFITYEFENVDADGLDIVIKVDNSHKERATSHFPNRIFEKDFLSQQDKSLWLLTRGCDLKQI